jgi:hypothetical protein
MSTKPTSARVAVICEPGSEHAEPLRAYLRSQGIEDARWYPPRDIDDVDMLIRRGTTDHVILHSWQTLLVGLWDQRIAFDQWTRAGVRVETLEPTPGDTGSLTTHVLATWSAWQQRRQRRQIIAGSLLSILALAAAFTILALAG